MTTVAWDGNTLAADRQCGGAYKRRGKKIWRLSNGALFGGAGVTEEVLAVRDWLDDEAKQKPERLSDFVGILVELGGATYRLEERLQRIPVRERCHAVGSGAPFAITAMIGFKATAREAVRIATRFDSGTGGGVDSLTSASSSSTT